MRILIIYIILLFSLQSFSQNRAEIEADYEIQGYFKNYENFNVDSLKNQKFKFVKEDDRGFGKLLFERKRDNGVSEKIYQVLINYIHGRYTKYKEYKVHTFSKNDSIFGLINYDPYREKANYYFDFGKLQNYLEYHNEFYQTKFTTTNFVNQVLDDHIYGYVCGFAPVVYDVPRYNNLMFDKKKNISEFRNWIKSFNPELQTYGIDALEYLEKNKRIKLTELDRKLISNIKNRNSILNTCSGCLGVYKKVKGN